ncbi:MAG: lysophospholipid acyltransferase (LPLAT)-like uncharacterized protein [Bacteroidia bacterium]
MSSKKIRKSIKRFRRKVGSFLMPYAAPFILRRLSASWDVEVIDQANFDEVLAAKGCLWTLWHGRMIAGLPHHDGYPFKVLVSPSKDGDLMDTLLPKFGMSVIRGSSSRTGARALREMLRSLRGGGIIVVTPDGPRGPRHSGSAGVVWLARATGYPILPCGFVAEPAWRVNSWDAFTIPKWGAKLAVVYEKPIYVDRHATDEELKLAHIQFRTALLAAERRGFQHLGVTPDWPEADLQEHWHPYVGEQAEDAS